MSETGSMDGAGWDGALITTELPPNLRVAFVTLIRAKFFEKG
jgi:hypothetical protein